MKNEFRKLSDFLVFEKELNSYCKELNSFLTIINSNRVNESDFQAEITNKIAKINRQKEFFLKKRELAKKAVTEQLTQILGKDFFSKMNLTLEEVFRGKDIPSTIILIEVLIQSELHFVKGILVRIFLSFREELIKKSYLNEVYVPTFIHEPIIEIFFHTGTKSSDLNVIVDIILELFEIPSGDNELIGMALKSLHLLSGDDTSKEILEKASLSPSPEIRNEAKKLLKIYGLQGK